MARPMALLGVRARPQRPVASSDLDVARLGRWALAAVLAVTAAQVAFLTVGCDWELTGDEAEYWTWSRRLDWSYYCRGPLIALVIRLSTELAGGLSRALTGSTMLAVRLPAVLMGAGTAWGVFRLGAEVARNARVGLIAVLILPAVPVFRLGGVTITVDTPLVFFWTWAAVWSYRGIVHDDLRAWTVAALLGGLGVLTKYTMLAFPASVGLFLVLSPAGRKHLLRPGFWVLAAGCALAVVPIVAWNAAHGWVGGSQLVDRVGLTGSARPSGLRTLATFLAGDVGVLGVWWWFGVLAIGRAGARVVEGRGLPSWTSGTRTVTRHPGDDGEPAGLLYLLCLWFVVWAACVSAALLGETEMNWSASSLVAIMVLIAWRFDRAVLRRAGWAGAKGMVALWVVCLLSLTAVQHTEWFYPLIARLAPTPTVARPSPLHSLDPTGRMRGNREVATEVSRQLSALRAAGQDPFILAPTYAAAATLEFYLPGHPDVYCLSRAPDCPNHPANQHDLWHPNPRFDPDAFLGRPAVTVQDANLYPSFSGTLAFRGWFAGAETPVRVQVERQGLPVATWDVAVCHNYQGPPPLPTASTAPVRP